MPAYVSKLDGAVRTSAGELPADSEWVAINLTELAAIQSIPAEFRKWDNALQQIVEATEAEKLILLDNQASLMDNLRQFFPASE